MTTATDRPPGPQVEERASMVARLSSIAADAADDVDARSRFPHETIDALRAAGLLGALVPVDGGGLGWSLDEVADLVTALGRHCASSAMVFAMHQIQVACLVRHGDTPALHALTRAIATDGLLLASATTEAGVGGNVRESRCHVERVGDRYRLTKQAPVISYGEHADVILATARRAEDSPPSDQVLVACRKAGYTLEATSTWDALGFRGTCSLGFVLRAEGDATDVLPEPYGDISSHTMLPVSHILWSSLWLGLAAVAAEKARRFVQGAARKAPDSVATSSLRLAELQTVLQEMHDLVHARRAEYARAADDPDRTASIAFAIQMNSLKVSASTYVVDVVQRALLVCGMAGYANHGPFTLGRHLRDAFGAQLMINNDRINANNAHLLLVHRER